MTLRPVKHIELALQGGGSHGAFTWGVLDRLLEDERIEIDAISGTSAGAMNAAVLAGGLIAGGRAAAREALRRFWSRVSNVSGRGSTAQDAMAAFFGNWSLTGSPLHLYLDWAGRSLAPHQFNPFNLNPLRHIIATEVDFESVRRSARIKLFISATNVRTGQLKEFRQPELSADAVMASACLPLLFRPVEIDGEAYWDGGYVGNPSLMPLITESPAHDLVLVQINPSRREALPLSVADILDRVDEITFNSSLVKELRSVALLQQLLQMEEAPVGGWRPQLFTQIAALRLHRIEAENELADLGAASKRNTGWPFLNRLFHIGYGAAATFLDCNFTHLGRRSTLPLASFIR